MNPPVPVLVLVDEGYFGHEALQDELGPGFAVRFAASAPELQAAFSAVDGPIGARPALECPIVLAPRTLDPVPGDVVLADLTRRRYDFIGALLVDEDSFDRLADGVHVLVRRPLRPGMLALHLQAAAAQRARWLHERGRAAALAEDFARLRDGLRHDLRGQLQTVVGLASLVLELERPKRALDDELIDFMSRISAAGARLTRFVDALGDWLNAARRPLEPAAVDLGELVLEVVARVKSCHPGILTIVLDPPDMTALGAVVMGDARLLHKALETLLERALALADRASVTLTRTAGGWSLAVFDLLPKPLPAHQLEKAFNLFERVAGGDGIALALVKKVAERHDAMVKLEPRPDGGHAVVLTLEGGPA